MPSPEKLILLIEDSADDVFFFRRELEKAGFRNPVYSVQTVDEAICYLEGTGDFADRSKFPMPSIAIIDLHLPHKDGFEFLRWLATKPQYRSLHVVVVTGIGRLQDVNRAYQMGANSFLTKPLKAQDLQNLATGFSAYWT
jgi:CheY-like chemotaxis protein